MKKAYICIRKDGLEGILQLALSAHKDIQVFIEDNALGLNKTISIIGPPDILIVDDLQFKKVDISLIKDIKHRIIFTEDSKFPKGFLPYKRTDWEMAYQKLFPPQEKYNSSEFSTIPFYILKNIQKPICDIFIEIKKNDIPNFIKLYNKDEEINKDSYEGYIDKGIVNAYIKTSHKSQFLNIISNHLYSKLLKKPSVEILGESLDTSILLLKDIGFNSTSTQLIEGVIEEVNKGLNSKSNKILKIKDLLASKTSKYYKKVHLTSLLGSKVIALNDWSSHHHQEVYTFACFFTDITLDNSDHLYITSNELYDNASLSKKDAQNIYEHAHHAFKLIQDYKERPQEADIIILEQHGSKNGYGFQPNRNHELQKSSVIFRICEDFTLELLKYKDMNKQIKIMDIFAMLYKKHDRKTLHHQIDLLKKCFIS